MGESNEFLVARRIMEHERFDETVEAERQADAAIAAQPNILKDLAMTFCFVLDDNQRLSRKRGILRRLGLRHRTKPASQFFYDAYEMDGITPLPNDSLYEGRYKTEDGRRLDIGSSMLWLINSCEVRSSVEVGVVEGRTLIDLTGEGSVEQIGPGSLRIRSPLKTESLLKTDARIVRVWDVAHGTAHDGTQFTERTVKYEIDANVGGITYGAPLASEDFSQENALSSEITEQDLVCGYLRQAIELIEAANKGR